MRNLATCLFAILVFGSPFVAGLGIRIWLHASGRASIQMATLIMAGVILGGYGLMLAGMLLRRSSERRVLFAVDDETLGRIQVRRDDWEATPLVAILDRQIKVRGERGEHIPTPEQAALWLEIVNRLEDLLAKSLLALQKDADSSIGKGFEFQTTELELTEVDLDGDGGFTFYMAPPLLRGKPPNVFYAEFSEFEVIEACHVH
jgi:hypothetical protein